MIRRAVPRSRSEFAPRRIVGAVTPNVLFITVDQWRGDCLSAAAHPVVKTPNLDKLASQGTRFTRHYAQAAPCGPSRASLLAGLYLHTHRSSWNGTPLDARFTNVALEARKAGYRPALYGYTDTTVDPRGLDAADPRLSTYESVLDGFDHAQALDDQYVPWFDWLACHGYDMSDPQRYLRPDANHPKASSRGSTWAPTPYDAEHTETAFITERVIEDIDAADGPFFIHASYIRPHPPFTVPAPYHDMYSADDVPSPVVHGSREEAAAAHPFLAAAMEWDWSSASVDEAEVRQLRATYYGMMTEVDHQMGRLMAALDVRGLAANTMVILTSDHGEMLGDRFLMSKLGYFDESFHIPLIVRTPEGQPGLVVDDFTENVDVMPTILDHIGVDIPNQCQGRSLAPFLTDAAPSDWRSAVHWEYDFRVFARRFSIPLELANLTVHRTATEKYVHFSGLPSLFFDLVEDPLELRNLANDPTHAPRVLESANALMSWRQATSEQLLTSKLATPTGMRNLHQPADVAADWRSLI